MKKALEKGCLAMVVKCALGASYGKIVECVEVAFVGHPQYGTIWLVCSPRKDLVDDMGGKSDTVHYPADWLVRIPDDPLPPEEDEVPLDELALEDA